MRFTGTIFGLIGTDSIVLQKSLTVHINVINLDDASLLEIVDISSTFISMLLVDHLNILLPFLPNFVHCTLIC